MLRQWVYLKLSTKGQTLYGRYKITLPRWKRALTRYGYTLTNSIGTWLYNSLLIFIETPAN